MDPTPHEGTVVAVCMRISTAKKESFFLFQEIIGDIDIGATEL